MRIKLGQKLIDKIRGKKRKASKIKQHPKRASNAESMKPFAEWVLNYTDLKPQIIFEIGANYGQDAEGLRYYFDLPESNVYCFEAHPDICKEIKKLYNFNVYNSAVYNQEKEMEFNVVDINSSNTGVSSLLSAEYNKDFKKIKLKSIRMDNFMKEHKIDKIDFLKLDVEGCNYEVLEGFGDRLKDVNVIHIEAEHIEIWKDQKLFDDIKNILSQNGFVMVYFQRYLSQSDSLWIQKKYIKK